MWAYFSTSHIYQVNIAYTMFAGALVYSALPTILVSCKCDNPVNTRQIDTESIEAACLAEVETVKTAANVPESARLCLGAMLRAIMANRIGWSNFSICYTFTQVDVV
jgi:hypothetical protein